MNTVQLPHRSPFFTYRAFRPFRLQPLDGPPLSLCDVTGSKSMFIQVLPASVSATGSLSYGLAIRPLLLPTPHRCDAVTKATER